MRRLLLFLGCLVVLAGAAAALLHQRYHGVGPTTSERIVEITPGSGLRAIAAQFEQAGLIADRYSFILGARLGGDADRLKAGEYAVPPRASMAAIVALLRSGKVVVHRLTIPEGLTVRQIVALVRAEPSLIGSIDQPPDEGTLLPETYYFERGATRPDLLDRMARAQDAALDRLWPSRAPELVLSRHATVVLASIVEKETAVAAERPRVASVFLNRLRRGMRLESDPTVVYGLTKGDGPLGRPLAHADLDRDSPYNTYRIAGLPPGPIANPGLASLRAVLRPVPTDALFFVADGTGGHAFAETFAEHRANVARWRRRNPAKPVPPGPGSEKAEKTGKAAPAGAKRHRGE